MKIKETLSLLLFITSISAIILFLNSCSSGNIDNPETDGYNRQSMLENLTDNIIIPSYINLNEKIIALETSTNNFSANITNQNLEDVRKKWLEAYKAWQYVEIFNIGKSEEIFYNLKMNTYPTDATRIESNIENNSYDLDNQANNFDAQGFPALDYMLYGLNQDSTLVLDKYLTEEYPNKYITYLENLVTHMKQNTNLVIEYWNDNRSTFINSYGNTATSSVNMLTNDFIYYYEKGLRANKIGIPAGVYSGILKDRVEAYYKRTASKTLALEALNASQNFFTGKSFSSNETGESLATYLNYINTNSTLSDIIISKFENAKDKIQILNDNFVYQIETNNMDMLYAYDALQENVVKLKTEMLFDLNISVDYIDADGD